MTKKTKTPKTKKEQKLKNVSRKSLKTMQKTHSRHVVREKARIVKYGTKGFGRNVWLSSAATAVMAITLIILFITVVASVILTNTAEMMKDKIDITVYFKPNLSRETLGKLEDVMKQDSNVKDVETSTSEEEYKKFLNENEASDDILGILDDELASMMVDKMQSTMRIKVYDVDNLDSIKKTVDENELFKVYTDKEKPPTYDVNRIEIATITSWARIARTGGIILAIVFLVISVLIIFSTIRMAIFSRREEIYMMKLVGADNSFIRGPFMIEAQICGIISGIIAATVGYIGYHAIAPQLESYGINIAPISSILETNWLFVVYIIIIAIGFLIGTISSSLAIRRYLNATAKRNKHHKKKKVKKIKTEKPASN